MPHVNIKLFPGKTEEQKKEFAQRIVDAGMEVMGTSEWAISVAFEEVTSKEWEEKVYAPEIQAKEQLLYVKPGYTLSNGKFSHP